MVHEITKTRSSRKIIVQEQTPIVKTIKAPKSDVFQDEETRKRVGRALHILSTPRARITYDLTEQEFHHLHAPPEENAMFAYFEGIAVINGYCTFVDNNPAVRNNANRVMKEYLELKQRTGALRTKEEQEELDDCKLDYTAGTAGTDTVAPILNARGNERERLREEHRKVVSAHIETDARYYKQATKFARRVQKLDKDKISTGDVKKVIDKDAAAWVAIKRLAISK